MKGFQVGINFIVIIIIAVLILTLGITWVQNLFSEIGILTTDTLKIAKQKLIDQIKQGDSSLGITLNDQDNDGVPEISKRFDEISAVNPLIVIKNTDKSNVRCYSIEIYLIGIGDGEIAESAGYSSNCKNERCPDWDALKAKLGTSNWFIPPAFVEIGPGKFQDFEALVDINEDAPLGEYQFKIKTESVIKSLGSCRDHDYTNVGNNGYESDFALFKFLLVA